MKSMQKRQPIKVLHVITGLSMGGAEMMLTYLIEALPEPAYEHVVLCLGPVTPTAEKLRQTGVAVFALGMKPSRPSIQALRALRKLVAKERPKFIHGWMYHGNLAATMAAFRSGGATLLWSVHHSLHDFAEERLLTRATVRLCAKASKIPKKIVYVSRRCAKQHERVGYCGDNAIVIPNGIDCTRYKPNMAERQVVRQSLGFDNEKIVIGLFARFHPIKDHETFLCGASILAKQYPDARFLLAGTNITWENRSLYDTINRLKLTQQTSLVGESASIERLYLALDICALSSRGEAFGLTIAEAMACGIPCVATDVGDIREMIGETGIVVPAGDPGALADAWSRVIEEGASGRAKLGVLARDRILRQTTLQVTGERYSQLYRALSQS
jgi:glycosyltransferase involved in cell wall biosynthesis